MYYYCPYMYVLHHFSFYHSVLPCPLCLKNSHTLFNKTPPPLSLFQFLFLINKSSIHSITKTLNSNPSNHPKKVELKKKKKMEINFIKTNWNVGYYLIELLSLFTLLFSSLHIFAPKRGDSIVVTSQIEMDKERRYRVR